MKKSLIAPPDSFALSPLLSLLPRFSGAARLEQLTSSLFARYEKVALLRRELTGSSDGLAGLKRCQAEEQMLKTILEWLEVDTAAGTSGQEGK